MAAISKAWMTIADAAVDPDSPGDATLMRGLRDNDIHLREWLGASFTAGAVKDHNHDGVNSALVEVGPNLLRNGSFEDDEAGWTITDYSGGSHAFLTSTRHHGEKSLSFTSTSTANGGGDALSNEFVAVAGSEWYEWSAQISASVANVSSRGSVVWYDADQSQLLEVNVYDITDTPTAKTKIGRGVKAPSSARFAKVKVTGGVPGAGSATGTIFFDGLLFFIAGHRVLIEEKEANGGAQLDFTSDIDGSFDFHEMEFDRLRPASDGVNLSIRFSGDGGSSFFSTNYQRATEVIGASSGTSSILSGNSTVSILLTDSNVSNSVAAGGFSGLVRLGNLADGASERPRMFGEGVYTANSGSPLQLVRVDIGGMYNGTSAIDALRVFAGAGNLASGKVRLYGVRKYLRTG